MAFSPIDPPRAPQSPASLSLADAALQRQNMLLRPGGVTLPATPADASLPATPQPGTQPPPVIWPLPLPAAPDRVSFSPQARESLQNAATGNGPDHAGSVAAGPQGKPGQAPQPAGTPRALSGRATTESAAPLRLAPWPADGVPAPQRQMLDALVRQLTAPGQAPQRVVAAQPWSAALEAQLAGAEDGLPPLRTWLVGLGAVQTSEGARPVAVALRVPAAWLQDQPPPAVGANAPAGPLAAAFAGKPQTLASGLFALVLQSPVRDGARTSALLAIDFTPWLAAQAATVYGRDPRSVGDPWLQMAALQAAGWRPPEEDEDRQAGQGTPCDTPGCPYAGRATCVQPFCMALRVAPAHEAQRLGDRPPPHGTPPLP